MLRSERACRSGPGGGAWWRRDQPLVDPAKVAALEALRERVPALKLTDDEREHYADDLA